MAETMYAAPQDAQAQFEAAIELVERIFGADSAVRHVDTVAAVLAAILANQANEPIGLRESLAKA